MRPSILTALLLALAALCALFATGHGDGSAADLLYFGLLLAPAAVCCVRAAVVREHRAAWLLIGAGIAAWGAADIYWEVALSALEEPPYPSLSDAGWLVFYPACAAAVVLMLRGRTLGRDHLLDGVIAAFGASALVTAIVFPPIIAMSLDAETAAAAVNLAYPIGDLTLLGLVIVAAALMGWRLSPAWALVGAGLVVSAVADVAYLRAVAVGAEEPGWVTVLWPAATIAFAWAALLPPTARPARAHGIRVLAIPHAFAVAAFGTLVWDHFARVSLLGLLFAAATIAAVLMRTWLTFLENQALLGRTTREARTDALTGLANRRALVADLERTLAGCSPDRPALLLLFDLNGFKSYNDRYGHPAGDALLARLGGRLAAAADGHAVAYRMGGDEFCVLVPAHDDRATDGILDACLDALCECGDGFVITAACGEHLLTSPDGTAADALGVADRRMYAQKNSERLSAGGQSAGVLMRVLEERDGELAHHLDDVSRFCDVVARELRMTDAARIALVRAAALHDIGKAAIPDAVLNKPGPLSDEEWAFMHRHTIIGERILLGAPSLADVAPLVRSSHERWDGAGYPDGLAGEQIPLGARVIAVCDAFDAMTSERAYRRAMSHDAAVDELRRCAGSHFDPAVVEAFTASLVSAPA